MFDDLELFDNYVEKRPIGMKRKSMFYEIPYWEHLKIAHLLDTVNILKNVSSSLWRHISSKKTSTLAARTDLISHGLKEIIG